MTRYIDEQLSALLDGELPVEQESLLLRRLGREPGRRATMARYGLIGELLRDAETGTTGLAISKRVSAALAAEAAPRQTAAPSAAPSAGPGLIGTGIAAGIALVVLLNLADLAGSKSLVKRNTPASVAAVVHDDHTAAGSTRMTRYLVSHSRYTNTTSRQLVDSHVAMASAAPAAWTTHD